MVSFGQFLLGLWAIPLLLLAMRAVYIGVQYPRRFSRKPALWAIGLIIGLFTPFMPATFIVLCVFARNEMKCRNEVKRSEVSSHAHLPAPRTPAAVDVQAPRSDAALD